MRPTTLFILAVCAAARMQAQPVQSLTLEPYTFRTYDGRATEAELGKLRVPENRSARNSHLITVSFVRLKSTATNPASPIVWLAGGPGVPGVAMAKVPVYASLFEKLRSVADVILLDQRSLGLSEPSLECHEPKPRKDLFRSATVWLSEADKLIRECDRSLRKKGIDVSAYTNSASADDVDDLRTAIGASKISLLGHSYGTVLAQEILRRHPANVDRLVFANVEGDDQLIALPHLWDALLQKLSLIAAADTAVPTEAKDILALAKRVVRQLDAHPATLHVRNAQSGDTATLTVGGFGLRWLFRNYVADARTYAGYPALLLAIDRGDYTKFSTEIGAHYFGFGRSQMATVTDCSVGWTKERFALAEGDTGAFFEMVNNQWRSDICKSLGYMGRPAVRPLLVSTAPALFISGTLDANTPAFQAEALRYGFLNSVHLVIENAGHETLPSAEVQALILDFFRGTDVSGRHIAFPPPRFAPWVRRE